MDKPELSNNNYTSGQYYILKADSIISADFYSPEKCKELEIKGGFKDFTIIQLIDFIKELSWQENITFMW